MAARDCPDRWVHSLNGQVVAFTGAVYFDDHHLVRAECNRRVERAGAWPVEDFSGQVTLLVEGDLRGKTLTDPGRGYSEKLVAAQDARRNGRPHVHVVDADGFAALLNGSPARCRRLRGTGKTVRVVAEPGEGMLGGPLVPHRVSAHRSVELSRDLSALDAGTKAHEKTVEALAAHLRRTGRHGKGPTRTAPKFDIGWQDGARTFIAEVKSLRATDQDQQIRLGVGQLLDYTSQLKANGHTVIPVLVLERKPDSGRWAALAADHGILLTYGPRFPGI